MSKLLRYFADRNICFVTTVTHQRKPILVRNATFLYESLKKYEERLGLAVIAHVILPDHCHLLIDSVAVSPATVMHRVKLSFSRRLRNLQKRLDGIIWQHRYWDHMIRDQEDLNNHINYIHYNPVKHGLVKNPFQWEYSSARTYLRNAYYSDDWGTIGERRFDGDYGE